MCELFAMSCREPAALTLSLDVLARHGGGAGPHRDGWGIAFYEGRDVHMLREAAACRGRIGRRERRNVVSTGPAGRSSKSEL